MVPRTRSLIAIGYKYIMCKFLYSIVTDNTGITHAGIPHLSKYLDQFYNFSILPAAHSFLIYNFFVYVNEFESRNISWQSDMAPEKFWVTQCCCIS